MPVSGGKRNSGERNIFPWMRRIGLENL